MTFRHSISLLLITLANTLSAEHLPGGNITYECLGGNQYQVTLTLFRECSGSTLLPQSLFFSSDCGSTFTAGPLPVSAGMEVSQLCPADLPNSTCNGGTLPGIEVYRVQTTVNLSPCNGWTISWHECCRSDSQNLVGNPGTHVSARLNSSSAPCNNSPVFTQDAIPYVCVNEPVNYNLAVTEPDGHTLRYRLISARHQATGIPVNYSGSNTGAQPVPGMAIDSITGQITLTPTMIGNIVTVVRVDEYLAGGQLAGSVMRDFPFVVIACPNTPPDPGSGQLVVTSGDTVMTSEMGLEICTTGAFCFNAVISDPEQSQSLTLTSNAASAIPGATFTATGTNPATATICWGGGGLEPGTYGIVITAEDNACPTPGVTTFAYTVTVLPNNAEACLGTNIQITRDPVGSWNMWPSPASDLLNVDLGGDNGAHMRMFDATGRLAREERLVEGINTVHIGDLPAGSYMIRITSEDKEYGGRLMIQR
jgi:large repetitive protein